MCSCMLHVPSRRVFSISLLLKFSSFYHPSHNQAIISYFLWLCYDSITFIFNRKYTIESANRGTTWPNHLNGTDSTIKPIETDRTQSNSWNSIVERNRISIEYYPNFWIRLKFVCVRLVRLRFDCVWLRCFGSEQIGSMFFSAANAASKFSPPSRQPEPCRGCSSRVSASQMNIKHIIEPKSNAIEWQFNRINRILPTIWTFD